jgi:glycosyltransferase involved in cell wall biosynthesis
LKIITTISSVGRTFVDQIAGVRGVGTDVKYVANTSPKTAGNALAGPKSEHAAYAELAKPEVWTYPALVSADTSVRTRFFAEASVIIATGEDIGYRLAFSALRHRSRAPVLIIFHGHSAYSPRNRLIIAALKQFRQVHWLTLSGSLQQQLLRDMRVPARQCHVIGHAADTDYFRATTAVPPLPLIAAAGTASRDYATLVEAVRPLDVPVRIAADSAWLAEPVNFGPSSLPSHVEARSYETFDRLRDLYDRATLVTVPIRPVRHAAGFAVIAEAMAMSRAVIATRNAAVSDFIIDGENGFLVDPSDVATLRARIETLIADPKLASAIGQAARKTMETQFSLDAWARRLDGIVRATSGRAA